MGQSLGRRIAVAVALLAGFYFIALALLAGLLVAGIGPYITEKIPGNLWISIACIASAFAIVRALVPRRVPFQAPGPRLDPDREPELFGLVREVADATGQEMPAEVYVDDEFNAAVTERGGLLGIGGERVLIVGLPVLDTLTVDQVKSIIAHEFGHYSGKDTKLGSFFFRTYDGIDRAVENLEKRESIWRHVFAWYGRFFLRRTGSVRRAQEFAADAVAAEVAGRETYARACWSMAGCGGAFGAYMDDEFIPAVNRGVRPPLREGFARFRSVPSVRDGIAEHVKELRELETHPYDTHPSLGERLAALGVEDPEATPAAGAPAVTLLRDPDALEEQLMRFRIADHWDEVEPVAWEEVPERALVPSWEHATEDLGEALGGSTVASMPDVLDALAERGGPIFDEDPEAIPPPDVRREIVATPAGCALALAMRNAGWELEAAPGEPVTLTRGGETVLPFERVAKLAANELSPEQWREWAEGAGVAELSLRGSAVAEREAVAAG